MNQRDLSRKDAAFLHGARQNLVLSRLVLALCLSSTVALSGCAKMRVGSQARPIRLSSAEYASVPSLEGRPHRRQSPLAPPSVPEHPFTAPSGTSSMHVDPYTSNAYAWSGPSGSSPEVSSRSMGYLGGECPTINFDKKGRILTVCVQHRTPALVLMDPHDLTLLATYKLPARRTPLFSIRAMTSDTSGGAYFYLDEQNRAVIGTGAGTIDVVRLEEAEGAQPRFVLDHRIDLTKELRLEGGKLDKITAVMPDFEGNKWFVGRYGTVGFVTLSGEVRASRLAGEEIQNSFAVAEDGAYIVSDHALYRYVVGQDGEPSIVWREAYDRGARRKLGQINQGSGTTPTVLDPGYVAIGDNAEPRMNVLVYKRDRTEGDRLICKTPVFREGASASENTFIGYGRSFIVENNAGYDIFTTMRGGKTSSPGVARVDVREDESGCDVIWESDEISQTAVPKLSTENGLVYLYTKRPDAGGVDAYYFTAVDFETGETAFRVLTGTGVRYDNHWAAIALAPDGTAYVGVLNGLVSVRDRLPFPLFETKEGMIAASESASSPSY